MKKRIIAFTLFLTMILPLTSMAAGFTDITETSHSWAYDAVMEMNEKGIIKGTSETTFAPDAEVTRIQTLLLMARIMGYNSSGITENIKKIYNVYADELSSLSTTYKNELAFLAFMGVFTTDDFKAMDLSEEITRQEAAFYIAKADGVEEDSLSSTYNDKFSDDSEISGTYKPYVYYVRDKGYMNGTGDNLFSPTTTLTRAQIATMLYRIMPNIDYTFVSASVDTVSVDDNKVQIYIAPKTHQLPQSAIIRNNGEEVGIAQIYGGLYGIAKTVNGEIVQVDLFFDAPTVVTEVDGIISHIGTSTKIIQIKDVITDIPANYNLISEGYKVIINEKESSFSQLREGDYVVLGLDKGNRIVTATVSDTSKELTDLVVENIEITSTDTILTVSDENGEIYEFDMNKSDAVIRKNGEIVTINSLSEGNKISKMQLLYNRVKSIDVFSEVVSNKGTIKTIHISDESYLVLSSNKVESTFMLNKDTEYYIFGESKSIYDLELGQNANVTLDGKNVSKIEVTLVSQTSDVKGTVIAVNTSGSFITVQTAAGESVIVYVSTKATSATKIIDNNAATSINKTLKDIDVGANITALGAMVNGVFEATTIVYSNN